MAHPVLDTAGMHRIAFVVLASALLPACLGPSRSPGRVGGSLLTMTGAAFAVHGATRDCSGGDFGEGIGCAITSGVETGFGSMLIVAGVTTLLINELRYLPPTPEEPPVRVLPVARRIPHVDGMPTPLAADPMLRRLTLQAGVLARAGHCSAVDLLAQRVAVLDPRYRRTGFLGDHAIVACIDR